MMSGLPNRLWRPMMQTGGRFQPPVQMRQVAPQTVQQSMGAPLGGARVSAPKPQPPPVYRPVNTAPVLQRKVLAAPPLYRPQAVSAVPVHRGGAPPVYRPQQEVPPALQRKRILTGPPVY